MTGLTKNTETKTENKSLVSAGQNTNQSVSKLHEWGCWCCCCCLRKQEATAAATSLGTITASAMRAQPDNGAHYRESGEWHRGLYLTPNWLWRAFIKTPRGVTARQRRASSVPPPPLCRLAPWVVRKPCWPAEVNVTHTADSIEQFQVSRPTTPVSFHTFLRVE